MRKNRVHGIKPAKSVAVRWLGAYGKADSIQEVADFEMNPGRQVACEVMQVNTKSGIKHARVGLLVDQSKTKLVRAYVGDSWTFTDGHRLLSKRDNRYVSSWGEAGGLQKMSRHHRSGYTEGTIDNPIYSSIVIQDDKPGTLSFTKKLSELTGLPIKNLLQCHVDAACN